MLSLIACLKMFVEKTMYACLLIGPLMSTCQLMSTTSLPSRKNNQAALQSMLHVLQLVSNQLCCYCSLPSLNQQCCTYVLIPLLHWRNYNTTSSGISNACLQLAIVTNQPDQIANLGRNSKCKLLLNMSNFLMDTVFAHNPSISSAAANCTQLQATA